LDGVFIGCSMNHCLGDGTGYWNFFNHCYQNRDQNRKILGFCDFAYPKGFES
jgi:hypothetical protein